MVRGREDVGGAVEGGWGRGVEWVGEEGKLED